MLNIDRDAIFTDAEGISLGRWCWGTILMTSRHLNGGNIRTKTAVVTAMCRRTKKDVILRMTS